jgi:hypothetical protein
MNSSASIASLSSISSASPFQGVADTKPSVALQDKLARCIQQLGDWQACPSSKTPEGKQIIQNLQTQIRSIESKIASADKTTQRQPANAPSDQGPAPHAIVSRAWESKTVGRLLDVFA